jgi:hypothetical protein
MPTYYKHETPGTVHIYAVGNYTFEETYNNYKAALNDPKSADGINVLIDVRSSKETRTSEEMRAIADLFAASSCFKGRCAMLVSPDSAVRYGLARMLSAFADMRNLKFSVFHEEKAALAWLKAEN